MKELIEGIKKPDSGLSMPGKNGVLTRYMPTASLKVIFMAGLRAYEGQNEQAWSRSFCKR